MNKSSMPLRLRTSSGDSASMNNQSGTREDTSPGHLGDLVQALASLFAQLYLDLTTRPSFVTELVPPACVVVSPFG
jgi:hypothetical protein